MYCSVFFISQCSCYATNVYCVSDDENERNISEIVSILTSLRFLVRSVEAEVLGLVLCILKPDKLFVLFEHIASLCLCYFENMVHSFSHYF